jgi:hypothetical protein
MNVKVISKETHSETGVLTPSSFAVASSRSLLVYSSSYASVSAGNYYLVITLSGSSKDEFNSVNTNANFTVISVVTEPPVPALVSAIYSSDGAFVSVTFNESTNQGGFTNYFSCKTFLEFNGMDSSACSWTDSRTVKITQSSSTGLLMLGLKDTILLKSGSPVRASCPASVDVGICSGWRSALSGTVKLQAPSMPISPIVQISAPSLLPPCQSFTLDLTSSTGNAGRAWQTMTIQVDSDSKDANNLNAINAFYTQNYTISPPKPLSSSKLTPGTMYFYSIKLCNFLSACGTASFQLTIDTNDKRPFVKILGSSSVSMYRHYPLRLKSMALVEECGKNVSFGIDYDWSIQPILGEVSQASLTSIKSISQNKALYVLPRYSLSAGIVYKVGLTVKSLLYSTVSQTSVTISVLHGNLHAIIKGGSKQVFQLSTTSTIDGSSSYDEDIQASSASGLSYQWSCNQLKSFTSTNCSETVRILYENSERSKVSVFPFDIKSLNATYELVLTVSDSTYSRTNSASVEFTIITNALNKLTIVTSQQSVTSISPSSSLVLKSTLDVFSPCVAEWKVNDASLNLQSITSTAVAQSFNVGAQLPFNLRVNAGALPTGSALNFMVTCGQSISAITVTVNGPPVPGSFVISPFNGTELTTLFSFTASFWSDSDLPLTYQFGLYSQHTQSNLVLLSRSSLSSLSTTLPAGDESNKHLINCTLEVYDVLNASSIAHQYPAVYTSSDSQHHLDTLFAAADSSQSIDDKKLLLSVATSILNRVNCSVSVNCTALNRLPCSSTPNTCGKCLSGFHGDSGDKNTLCGRIPQFTNASLIPVGGCVSDSDCTVGLQVCSNHQCVYNSKKCPLDCSGNGICSFFYLSTGISLSECRINDLSCYGVCACRSGFTGSGCQVDELNLPKLQSYRAKLVDTLVNLTQTDVVTTETVSSWSSYLTAVSKNPYEIPTNDLHVIQGIALKTISQAKSLGLDSSVVAGVLDAVDGVATMRILNGDITTNSSSATVADNILTVIGKYSEILSSNAVFGDPTVDYVYDNFRITVNSIYIPSPEDMDYNNQPNSNITLTVAQTQIEQLLQLPTSKVQLLFNMTGGERKNISTFTASLIQTYQKSYTKKDNTFYSDPLRMQFTTPDNSNNEEELINSGVFSNFIFHIHNNEATDNFLFGNITKVNFTTLCMPEEVKNTSFLCPYSGTELKHYCDGQFHGTLISHCPKVMPSCNKINITNSEVFPTLRACTLVNHTETETVCSCAVAIPEEFDSSSNSSRRRSLMMSTSASDGALLDQPSCTTNLVAATEFFVDDFTDAFSAADDLNSKDGAKKSLVIIVLLGAVWGIGLSVLIVVNIHENYSYRLMDHNQPAKKDKKQESKKLKTGSGSFQGVDGTPEFEHNEDDEDHKEILTLAQQTRKQILAYVDVIIPAVYNSSETFLQRSFRELGLHHRYLHLFIPDKRKHDFLDRIYRTMKILTVQTLAMFLQAILFDLQNPEDDGSCSAHLTEDACLLRKTPLDQYQTYCQWDLSATKDNCQYLPPVFSEQAILYVIIITAMCTAALKVPIDMCLKIWICPVYEDHKKKYAVAKTTKDPNKITPNGKVLPALAGKSEDMFDAMEAQAGAMMQQKLRVPSVILRKTHPKPPKTLWAKITGFFSSNKFDDKVNQSRSIPLELIRRHYATHENFTKIETTALRLLGEDEDSDDDYAFERESSGNSLLNSEEHGATSAKLLGLFFTSGKAKTWDKTASVLDINLDEDEAEQQHQQSQLAIEAVLTHQLCEDILKNRLEMINVIEQRRLTLPPVPSNEEYTRSLFASHSFREQIRENTKNRDLHQLLHQHEKMLLLYDQQWGIKPDYQSEEATAEVLKSVDKNFEPAFEPKALDTYHRFFGNLRHELKRHKRIFKNLNNASAGLELMYFFVVDLLGQSTTAAKIFRNKFNEDFAVMRIVSRWFKYLCILFIFLLNGFFIYYMLLKGAYKGYRWQIQYCQAVITQFLIELIMFETIECVFLHYLIPESVRIDVKKAIYVLEVLAANVEKLVDQKEHVVHHTHYRRSFMLARRNSMVTPGGKNSPGNNSPMTPGAKSNNSPMAASPVRRKSVFQRLHSQKMRRTSVIGGSLQQFQKQFEERQNEALLHQNGRIRVSADENDNFIDHDDKFDSSKYLFLSKQLCQLRPELIETRIISAYHNHFPGMICHTWEHYKKALQDEFVKNHGTFLSRVIKSLTFGWRSAQPQAVTVGEKALNRHLNSFRDINRLKQTEYESNRWIPRAYDFLSSYAYIMVAIVAARVIKMLHIIGILPSLTQKIVIRVLQTSTLSGLTVLWYNARTQKSYYSIFGAIAGFILMVVIFRFAYVEKDAKADALLNQKIKKLNTNLNAENSNTEEGHVHRSVKKLKGEDFQKRIRNFSYSSSSCSSSESESETSSSYSSFAGSYDSREETDLIDEQTLTRSKKGLPAGGRSLKGKKLPMRRKINRISVSNSFSKSFDDGLSSAEEEERIISEKAKQKKKQKAEAHALFDDMLLNAELDQVEELAMELEEHQKQKHKQHDESSHHHKHHHHNHENRRLSHSPQDKLQEHLFSPPHHKEDTRASVAGGGGGGEHNPIMDAINFVAKNFSLLTSTKTPPQVKQETPGFLTRSYGSSLEEGLHSPRVLKASFSIREEKMKAIRQSVQRLKTKKDSMIIRRFDSGSGKEFGKFSSKKPLPSDQLQHINHNNDNTNNIDDNNKNNPNLSKSLNNSMFSSVVRSSVSLLKSKTSRHVSVAAVSSSSFMKKKASFKAMQKRNSSELLMKSLVNKNILTRGEEPSTPERLSQYFDGASFDLEDGESPGMIIPTAGNSPDSPVGSSLKGEDGEESENDFIPSEPGSPLPIPPARLPFIYGSLKKSNSDPLVTKRKGKDGNDHNEGELLAVESLSDDSDYESIKHSLQLIKSPNKKPNSKKRGDDRKGFNNPRRLEL